MISAEIKQKSGIITGFTVSGHSGYAESGHDIVCASVSSAVLFVCNGITEIAHIEADVNAFDDTVALTVADKNNNQSCQLLLKAFKLHIELLCEEFSDFLTLTVSEV